MRNKIALGITAFAGLAILFIYYWLGGFNSLQVQTVEVGNYYVAGRYFQGTYKSDTVASYFMETKQLIEQGDLDGVLTLIYDQEPTGKRGQMKSFIGVTMSDTTATLPAGFEWRRIRSDRVVQAKIASHVAVMPNPEKIKERIQDHAKYEGLKLAEYSIEKYLSDWEVITEVPVLP